MYNGSLYPVNMGMPMNNLYNRNPYPMVQNQQQVTQVSGKASVDTLQLPPNSSLLALDTTAPIVWLCVSDGIGKTTATPYDIIEHKEEAPGNDLEERLNKIEESIKRLESEKVNYESNTNKFKSKHDESKPSAN